MSMRVIPRNSREATATEMYRLPLLPLYTCRSVRTVPGSSFFSVASTRLALLSICLRRWSRIALSCLFRYIERGISCKQESVKKPHCCEPL